MKVGASASASATVREHGIAALLNLASAWACSLNDVYEGSAVILAALAVWAFGTC